MPRVALDLEQKADLSVIKSDGWRIAQGLEPGEPNQGLVAEMLGSNARLPDYDDSSWESSADFQKRYSVGFTFAWYRLRFTHAGYSKGTGRGPMPGVVRDQRGQLRRGVHRRPD